MPRPESFRPTVERIVAGAFVGDGAYSGWRSRGTSDWLVVNTRAGGGSFRGQDGSALTVGAGDLTLIRPGAVHDYGTAPGAGAWDLQFAHFHPRPDWISLLDWPEPIRDVRRLSVMGVARERVAEAFDRAVVVTRSGLAHAELFGLNALENALLWAATQAPASPQLDPRLVLVLEHVSARLAEPLSTSALARLAGLSPSRLAHLFVTQLGVPPMRFVEQQRMRAAQQLLDLSSTPVAAVGRAVGYPDPLYFSTRFKRFAGCSPSTYRSREPGSSAPDQGGQ